MELSVLRTFIAVCEYNGFSAASEKLGYTQSTVSFQIKQLEKELGTVLFDRIRHGIRITDNGLLVLEYAKKAVALTDELENALHHKDKIKGHLRLAMANSIRASYFKEDYLKFHQLYPDINISIIECGTDTMFDLLRKNEVDVVFTLDNHISDPEFIICSEALEQIHFVTSISNPLLNKKNLKIRDLLNEHFILTETDMSYRKLFDQRLSEESLTIEPVFEIGSSDQICSLIAQSGDISFLPDFITGKYIDSGKLSILPVKDVNINVWTQMLVHRSKWISPVISAFLDFYSHVINR